ncbi:MAG: PilZ domain-containing protein [Candidatus Methylomirabilales bacterium]
MDGTTVERRRYSRCALKGQVSGRIGFRSVSPLDLSLGGVQIEHFQIVRPGTTTFLTLFFPNTEVTLKCAVARSAADRPVIQDDGEREIIYRTGLEFLSTTEDVRRVIGAYVSAACPPTSQFL